MLTSLMSGGERKFLFDTGPPVTCRKQRKAQMDTKHGWTQRTGGHKAWMDRWAQSKWEVMDDVDNRVRIP